MTNVTERALEYWEAVTVVRRVLPADLRADHVNGSLSAMAAIAPDPLIRQRYLRAVHEFRRAGVA